MTPSIPAFMPENNNQLPIWYVHTSAHWDWSQSSHAVDEYAHPPFVRLPDTHIPIRYSANFLCCILYFLDIQAGQIVIYGIDAIEIKYIL